jgi:hypothetical protein
LFLCHIRSYIIKKTFTRLNMNFLRAEPGSEERSWCTVRSNNARATWVRASLGKHLEITHSWYTGHTTKAAKTDNENGTVISCRVRHLILFATQAHTGAETLIKPCAIGTAEWCWMCNRVEGSFMKSNYRIVLFTVTLKIYQLIQNTGQCRDVNHVTAFFINGPISRHVWTDTITSVCSLMLL